MRAGRPLHAWTWHVLAWRGPIPTSVIRSAMRGSILFFPMGQQPPVSQPVPKEQQSKQLCQPDGLFTIPIPGAQLAALSCWRPLEEVGRRRVCTSATLPDS